MKELKIRAYYKPQKRMLSPKEIESINFDTKVLGVYLEMDGRGYQKLRMSDSIIMSYTGVHEDTEDEAELCDGDIVKLKYEDTLHICKIQYCGSGFMFVADSLPDGYMWMSSFIEFDRTYCWAERVKKIGNIYENPELLEG